MILNSVISLYTHRKYFYNILFLLKMLYLFQKIKRTYHITTQIVDDWIFVEKN